MAHLQAPTRKDKEHAQHMESLALHFIHTIGTFLCRGGHNYTSH